MDLHMEDSKIRELVSIHGLDKLKPDEIEPFITQMRKHLIESALEGELQAHLGYARYERNERGSQNNNSRNGKTGKTIKTEKGPITIAVPRDRNGTFEPQIVQKGQRRTGILDDQIIALYAKGMTTREITETIRQMYEVDVSPTLVSHVTDKVMDDVMAWQNRHLDPIYPIVYLDCIVVKIRESGRVINKSIYVALGVNLEGKKELLGLWLSVNEGAKFWLGILTELRNRGLEDILIVCIDGLRGFPEAIEAVYPQAQVQLCVVHMVRNSMKYVSWKDYKAVASQLREIYSASTESQARQALERFEATWSQYSMIGPLWRRHWEHLVTMFGYDDEIRKVIYTTNAIESLNSVIRKATKRHKLFPSDESALKVVFLAINAASKKWTMPIRNWKKALNRFSIEYGERVTQYL